MMNGNEPLHPNLARIAAEYDRVMYRFSVNQIDASTARAHLAVLQARDDEGVVWMLDPENGEWKYQTRGGDWVFADPPKSGVATLTAHDLSRDPTKFNPDSKIQFDETEVEQRGLQGSVKGQVVQPRQTKDRGWIKRVLIALAVAVALVVGATVLSGGDEQTTVGDTQVPGTQQEADPGVGGVGPAPAGS